MFDWIVKSTELREQGKPFVVVTVVRVSGSTPRETGAKMLVCSETEFYGTIGGGRLELLTLKEATARLRNGEAAMVRFPLGATAGQCCGGTVEVFFEPQITKARFYLFGAGHVGQAVARTLIGTPFEVHVIEDRPEWTSKLPAEVISHTEPWEDVVESISWNARNTYVAIMTHEHSLDQDILAAVLRKPSRYLGLIGSESKWARFQQRLLSKGFSDAELSRVRCPLGVDLGNAKSPQEIAISLSAEMLQIHYADFRDIPVLILAGGKGTRAGGPKGLFHIDGRPWLSLQLEALRQIGFRKTVVVLGFSADEYNREVLELQNPRKDIAVTVNPTPDFGPFSSVQTGIRTLATRTPCFVLPVDVPVPNGLVWKELFAQIDTKLAAVPSLHGRLGHPVLLSEKICELVLTLPSGTSRLDLLLKSLRAEGQMADVMVTDEKTLANLNQGEDFLRLMSDKISDGLETK